MPASSLSPITIVNGGATILVESTPMKPRILLLVLLSLFVSVRSGPAQVKSPQDYLGFRVGDDYKLADWQQITGYFDQLGKTSNRVRVETIGQTTLKKPFLRVTISSPENLAKLDRYEEITRRLADPRGLTPEEAEQPDRGREVRDRDHLFGARHRSRRRADVDGARLQHGDQEHGGGEEHPRQRDLHPRAVAQSRRPRHRRELAAEDGEHAVRRGAGAGALPPLRRPRQQPRLVHVHAGGDAQHDRRRLQEVAPAGALRRAPDGQHRRAAVRAAVSGSVRAEHRSDPDSGGVVHRTGDDEPPDRRGEDRHHHQRRVRRVDAGPRLPALSRRRAHPDGGGERALRVADPPELQRSAPGPRLRPAGDELEVSRRSGAAANGACATSSTTS